ncbi:MAG: DUF1338 domain-containing protein [Elusimicrobia bacterium]|nr:DUF1338 domain-containing protein [Elusimicrobiota bacterium]
MLAPHRSIAPQDDAERFLIELLDGLWARYRSRLEPVRRYEALVERHGGIFRNDHIAFRTLAWQDPAAGIFSISRLFEALGYSAAGCYEFPDKKLSSIHYRHRNPLMPKLFISQLKTWELSDPARAVVGRTMAGHRPPPGDDLLSKPSLDAYLRHFAERPWPAPPKADVETLERESQFGAWVLVHGYDVNHFTASVDSHGCEALSDIEKTVAALRAEGVTMKAEIEGERGSALRQSSTTAAVLPVQTAEGTMDWTYAYFELAERPARPNPKTGELERFEGFFGAQAANLFDVTAFGGRKE